MPVKADRPPPTTNTTMPNLSTAFSIVVVSALFFGPDTLRSQDSGATSRQTVIDSTVGRRRILPLPAIGSTPETGLQYGITVLAVFDAPAMQHRRPTSMLASAIRTTKGQVRLSFDAERWGQNNDWRLAFNGAWQKFPLPFYGFGDEAPEVARELYTPQGVDVTTTGQRRLIGSLYAIGVARLIDTDIVRTDSIGVLRTGTILGSDGGRSVELTTGLMIDSRDNLFAPTRGSFQQVTVGRADGAFGSDFDYTRIRIDSRNYRGFGEHVFATQILLNGVSDGAAFDNISQVGATDIMRGYARGRYRDQWMVAAQLEYRTPIRHRVGAVVFAGAGRVDSTFSDLGSARTLPTYGAGLRLQLDAQQRTAVRIDYGRGTSGSTGLYIGFNQAF